jgi:hypothetical protein
MLVVVLSGQNAAKTSFLTSHRMLHQENCCSIRDTTSTVKKKRSKVRPNCAYHGNMVEPRSFQLDLPTCEVKGN